MRQMYIVKFRREYEEWTVIMSEEREVWNVIILAPNDTTYT